MWLLTHITERRKESAAVLVLNSVLTSILIPWLCPQAIDMLVMWLLGWVSGAPGLPRSLHPDWEPHELPTGSERIAGLAPCDGYTVTIHENMKWHGTQLFAHATSLLPSGYPACFITGSYTDVRLNTIVGSVESSDSDPWVRTLLFQHHSNCSLKVIIWVWSVTPHAHMLNA